MARICVFAGSAPGSRSAYIRTAERVGARLAHRGIGVVFGGGHVGMMGRLADAALEAGGTVIGVIPRALVEREQAHRALADLRVVEGMHERKALMSQLSDAFLVLPGGIGTLEEMFEVLTWAQLGFHHKPVGLLDVEGYFEPLLLFLDRAVDEGFLDREARALLHTDTDTEALVHKLLSPHP